MFLLVLLSINLEEEISSEKFVLSLMTFLASFTTYLYFSYNLLLITYNFHLFD